MSDREHGRKPRNPREKLAGASPRQRGLEKLIQALTWALKFHVTHPMIIEELLGISEPRYLRELAKKGYFRAFQAPSLLTGAAYILTAKGRDTALQALGQDIPYDIHPSSVYHSTLKHNLAVQRVCIRWMHHENEILPERLMVWAGARRPDALLVRNGVRYAMEVEISGKWHAELEQSLYSHAEAIREGHCAAVIYASNSRPLLQRYMDALSKPMYAWYPYQEQGKPRTWTRDPDRVTLDPSIQACFHFGHVPTMLNGFQLMFQGRKGEESPSW